VQFVFQNAQSTPYMHKMTSLLINKNLLKSTQNYLHIGLPSLDEKIRCLMPRNGVKNPTRLFG
jgi:hypothetical protein